MNCKLEYLPVVPLPLGDNVIKWYMDMIVQMADDLELDYIFAHADEAINSKMLIYPGSIRKGMIRSFPSWEVFTQF